MHNNTVSQLPRLVLHGLDVVRYVAQRDIVELAWKRVKSGPIHDLDRLRPLFQATGYYPLILLNATAQLALSHHFDDELSQQVSVTVNTQAARMERAAVQGRSAPPAASAQHQIHSSNWPWAM